MHDGQKTATATDLRFLLGPGVAVQVLSNADLGRSELDGLIALVTAQRDVLVRASARVSKGVSDAE